MEVKQIETWLADQWFLKKHYAGRMPNTVYCFGLFIDDVLTAIASFGMSANSNLNEFIPGVRVLEFNRLISDKHKKNLLSFFIGQIFKQLPKPLILISYADTTQGHHGYIYQATNWKYTGLGEPDYEFIKNGRQYHRKNLFHKYGTGSLENAKNNGFEVIKVQSKHRYIYVLGDKRIKKKILNFIENKWGFYEYPKGDNSSYDDTFQPDIQIMF